jgi:predicted AAA+ superfamily ATPase
VFIELLRRDYKVYIGKMWNGEIDFVIKDNNGILKYIQVTRLLDEKNWKREIGSFEAIRDNYEKIVLSLYDGTKVLDNDIKVENIINWLLNIKI